MLKRFTSPKYASLFEYGTSVADAYLLRRGLFMPWELPQLLDPELIRQGWTELDPQLRLRQESEGLRHSFSQVAALELGWYMRSQLLRDADWAGMAHSLEIRVPLVDNELFHTVLPMVTGRRPPSKRDMALTPVLSLPPEVLDRPKSGFNVPVPDWQRRDAETVAAPARGLRNWARYVFGALTPATVS